MAASRLQDRHDIGKSNEMHKLLVYRPYFLSITPSAEFLSIIEGCFAHQKDHQLRRFLTAENTTVEVFSREPGSIPAGEQNEYMTVGYVQLFATEYEIKVAIGGTCMTWYDAKLPSF